ncbi:unnamed protein product [Withania somnifera]
MYYNGVYHLFYQYNPKGSVWGNIVWAHAVSTDLINWIRLEHALYPSKVFDKYGTWSGSVTILPNNKPIILYTGIVDVNNTQVQNYAVPADLSDPFLRKWIKHDNNPLVQNTHFIHLLIGNWECPDFFPVSLNHTNGLDTSFDGENVKHVLKVSLDSTRFEYYTIGVYDTKKDRYIPDETLIDGWKGLRLDYGNFYASKTFYDPSKNRRIFGKQLVQWHVEELETLRKRQKVEIRDHHLNKGEMVEVKGITYRTRFGFIFFADVEVTFSFSSLENVEKFDPSWTYLYAQDVCAIRGSTVQGGLGPFGLLTLTSKTLKSTHPCSSEYSRLKINIRFLCARCVKIDHSVVESFGVGGKICITSRVYPALAIYDETHLFAFNNGTEKIIIETLDAWSMGKPER